MLINLKNWLPFVGIANGDCFIDQITIDSRRLHSKKSLFIALEGTRTNGHLFVRHALDNGALFAVVQKGFSCEGYEKKLIEVENPLLALQELAGLYRKELKTTIVAITGLCGKTMLKDLLSHIYADPNVFSSPESFNSQIGVALSVLSIHPNQTLAFIEAAATQVGEMERICRFLQPDFAVVTNLTHARLSNEDPHISSKEALNALAHLPEGSWALVPASPHVESTSTKAKVHFWDQPSFEMPIILSHKDSDSWTMCSPRGETSHFTLPRKERYFLDLISTGVKTASLLGKPYEEICNALSSWSPEPMRTEVWKNSQGTIFINDSYSKDIMSFDVAMRQIGIFEGRLGQRRGQRAMLFGGLRDSDSLTSTELKAFVRSTVGSLVQKVFIWPETLGNNIKKAFSDSEPHVSVYASPTLKEAIAQAKAELNPEDLILIKGPNKISPTLLFQEFEGSIPHNLIIINLAAIKANIQTLRRRVGISTRLMIMVKALAYGTDDVRIAKFLNSSCAIDILGVSYVDEGVSMRNHGVTCSIFTLHATALEMQKALTFNLEIGVSTLAEVEAAACAAQILQKPFKLHLHVDTGMKRMGCSPQDARTIGRAIAANKNLIFEGLFTHLAASDDHTEDLFTLSQAQSLHEVYTTLKSEGIHPQYCHASNSSASMRFHFPEFTMVRIGLAAYGLHTSKVTEEHIELRPAISLISNIVAFNEALPGDTVSYGRSHTVKASTRLAVLPIGYFDGLHRNYSGKGEVLIRGQKAPMVGRICMDYMMVDVGHIPEASLGDPVLIFGEDETGSYISPEELAHAGGSIVHELITCLGPRIQRLFIYDESLRAR